MKKNLLLFVALFAIFWGNFAYATDYYVSTTGLDTNDGLTSGTPLLTIGAAIAKVATGETSTINIAAGEYLVAAALNPGDKSLSFVGADKATTFIAANTDAAPTTNARTVFSCTTALTAARTYTFSNLTIKNGYYNSTGGFATGLYISTGTTYLLTLNVTNVNFTHNYNTGSTTHGGAVNLAGNSTATFTNCKFENNRTGYAGGGGAIYTSLGSNSINVNNCYFLSNQGGTMGGGAICCRSAGTVSLTVKNSSFVSNLSGTTSSGRGGAIGFASAAGSQTLFVENSTFNQNTAGSSTTSGKTGVGGAIFLSASSNATNSVTINHCTITGNTTKTLTSGGGDGVCISSTGTNNTNLIINNSVIIGNTGSTANASQVGTDATSQAKINSCGSGSTVTNSILGVYDTSWGVTTGETASNYNYNNKTDAVNADLAWGTITTDATPVLPIGTASIARNYVRTDKLASPLSTDQIGQSRMYKADAGAYESQSPVYQVTLTAGSGGSVSAPTGGYGDGYYDSGANATITATANASYAFDKWTNTIGGSDFSTSNPFTFAVSENKSLTANFVTSSSPSTSVSTLSLTGFKCGPTTGPSTEQSFTVSGANLTNDIVVSPPANYEISTETGGSFSATNPITFSKDRDGNGTVTNATIYVRLKNGLTASTTYNENIAVASIGASPDLSVACSGYTLAAQPTTAVSTITASVIAPTSLNLSWSGSDGAKHVVVYSTNNDVNSVNLPVGGTSYAAGNVISSGYIVGYAGSASSATITGLTANTTYYFAVFPYNDGGVASYENYFTASAITQSQSTAIASNATDYFQSRVSGNWTTGTTWNSSNDNSSWHIADLTPGASSAGVLISTGNTVTISASPSAASTGISLADGSTISLGANNVTIPSSTFAGTTAVIDAGASYGTKVSGLSAANGNVVTLQGSYNTNGPSITCTFDPNGTLSSGSELVLNGTGTTENKFGINATSTSSYLSNTKVTLKSKAFLIVSASQGSASTLNIGTLEGETNTKIGWGQSSDNSRDITWSVGASGLSSTYAGSITNTGGYNSNMKIGNNTHFTKVGSGVLTFSGTATSHNGNFNVSGGELKVTGAIGKSTTIINVNGGLLSATGSGTITSDVLNVASGASVSIGATSVVTLNAVNVTTNGSASGQLNLQNATIIPSLTITSTSAPAVGTTIQIVNAEDPSSIVYTTTPVVPVGYSYNNATGVLTYNGSTLSNADVSNLSTLSLPSNATLDISNATSMLEIDQNASFNNLSITAGAKLNVSATKTLNVSSLNLNSDASGTATFVNNGTAAITSATVNQYLTAGRNWYVSSPVTAAPYTVLSSATSVQYWDEAAGSWAVKSSGNLDQGKGYISVATNATGNVTFTGTLNDGDITVNLTRTKDAVKSGFNLVGNPYPSFLSWELVEKTNVQPTIWYRTKNTAGVYKFGTYNTTSQIGTNVGANDTDLKDIVTGNIPPMQAFWVRVSPSVDGNSTTGSLTFKNTMRAHKGTQLQGDGQTRNDGPLRVNAVNESKVLRLQISNDINQDETILLFNNNATNGLDDFDSYKMSNNAIDIPEIFTTSNGESLVINGLNNFENDLEIPVGFTTLKAGTFSIKASQVSNFEPGTQLILKDYINGMPVITSLSEGESYSFTSTESVNNNSRFTVSLKAPSTVTDIQSLEKGALITLAGNDLIINGDGKVDVINVVGQKILTQNVEGSKRISLATGVYMVSVSKQGHKVTQKVIIH